MVLSRSEREVGELGQKELGQLGLVERQGTEGGEFGAKKEMG